LADLEEHEPGKEVSTFKFAPPQAVQFTDLFHKVRSVGEMCAARLASFARCVCVTLRQARLARSLGVLGFLLLTNAALSGCERYSELERRTIIAYTKLAVSYPIVATVIPFDGYTIAFFLNLADGSVRRLFDENVNYVGVQKMPGKNGRFILAREKSKNFSFVEYDFQSNTSRILQDTDVAVTTPFVMGNKNCGLYPGELDVKMLLKPL
jgi:hypothetical protein